MGLVYADIGIINGEEFVMDRRNYVNPEHPYFAQLKLK